MAFTGAFRFIGYRVSAEFFREHPFWRRMWHYGLTFLRPKGAVEINYGDYILSADFSNRATLGRRFFRHLDYEPLETAVFKALLKPDMCILDVGANIGHYGLTAAGILGKECRIEAFEPSPVAFAELSRHVEINDFSKQMVARNMALSNETGEMIIHVDKKLGGHHSLIEANIHESGGAFKVDTMRMDEFKETYLNGQKIDLIKMDTQGNEARILEGAAEVLKNDRPIIITEFWLTGMENAGCDPWEMYDMLEKSGYRILVVDEEWGLLEMDKAELKERLIEERNNPETNLMAIPKDEFESLFNKVKEAI